MTKLSFLSVARFSGPDAGRFLHAQLSADIAGLASGKAVFACYCSPRGQVISLLLVCRECDAYFVVGANELLPAVLRRFGMFVLRSKVEFAIESEMKVFGHAVEESATVEGGIFKPEAVDLAYLLSDQSQPADGNEEDWRVLELKNNVTWLEPATSEKFIPQMLGFDGIGAVSFSKGCYPGQEIVARARYLGKVKRKPLLVATAEELRLDPGQTVELLRAEQWTAAIVVDSVFVQDQGTVLFTVTPEEPADSPSRVRNGAQDYLCATM
jgi:folate-binding protein YgfZ